MAGTGGTVPTTTMHERVMLAVTNSHAAHLSTMAGARRYAMPLSDLVKQATSDRLFLAGEHLRAADDLLVRGAFRSAISRYYYSMYHSARAIVFAVTQGDDYERHSVLPRNLPSSLDHRSTRESELTDARLLRNQADYDPYPAQDGRWNHDARSLGVVSSSFVQSCEDFALENGYL